MPQPIQENSSPLGNLIERVALTGEIPEQAKIIESLTREVERQTATFQAALQATNWSISYDSQAEAFDIFAVERLNLSVISHTQIQHIMLHDMGPETLPNYRIMAGILRPLLDSIPIFEDRAAGYGINDTRRRQAPMVRKIIDERCATFLLLG